MSAATATDSASSRHVRAAKTVALAAIHALYSRQEYDDFQEQFERSSALMAQKIAAKDAKAAALLAKREAKIAQKIKAKEAKLAQDKRKLYQRIMEMKKERAALPPRIASSRIHSLVPTNNHENDEHYYENEWKIWAQDR